MHKGRFETLHELLSKRLVDWCECYMYNRSMELLIKEIDEAIPTYAMSVFWMSSSVCDDLTWLIHQYWCGMKNDKSKMVGLSWDKMRLPKSRRGMGFSDMHTFNQALLAKQA